MFPLAPLSFPSANDLRLQGAYILATLTQGAACQARSALGKVAHAHLGRTRPNALISSTKSDNLSQRRRYTSTQKTGSTLNSADKLRSDVIHRIGRKDRGIRRIRRRMALNEREKCEGNRANCGNFGEKHGKDIQNGLSEEGKHRTSRTQTSVLLHQNIGGFAQRSPMFCIFQRRNA